MTGAFGTAFTVSVVISLKSSPEFSSSHGSRCWLHSMKLVRVSFVSSGTKWWKGNGRRVMRGEGSLVYGIALPINEMRGPVDQVVRGR